MTNGRGYPEYKKSGTDWLGKIPAHWDMVKLKNGFDLQKRPAVKSAGIVTAFRDGQVTLRSNRRIDGFTEGDKQIGYQTILPGDLVIHAMDAFAGAIGVSDSFGQSTPVYSVCTPKSGFNTFFYARVLRHIALTGYITSLAKGVRERSTDFRWADAKELPVPKPPLDEQNKIVEYLDRETAQIDELIGKQERLIELLAEKRQAIITHAVTKGLDPNAPTKLSGIPWLGDIPSIWETKRLKYIVAMRSGESITAEDIESIGDYPVYGGNGLRGYTSAYTHEGEYALIGRQGALCGNVNLARGQFWASEHAIVPTPRIQISVHWLFHVLKWMNLGQYSMTAAQPGISADAIGGLPVPFPSFDEQQKIADYIERQTRTLDRLTVAASSAIQLLRERRSALISAAVTGKIDVREGVA